MKKREFRNLRQGGRTVGQYVDHARGVRPRDLQVGDLVLRLRQDARGRHKLTPPWEGPFVIAKVLKPGTYKLANSQGEVYSNAWNIQQLRRFYP